MLERLVVRAEKILSTISTLSKDDDEINNIMEFSEKIAEYVSEKVLHVEEFTNTENNKLEEEEDPEFIE